MGLLPGYDAMGIAAPVTLILLRMVQGLSVGGQLAGSYVVSIEQSTVNNRGVRGSICDASSVSILWSFVFLLNQNIHVHAHIDIRLEVS